MISSGKLITLEGGEGAGKSTLAKSLAKFLMNLGIEVEITREPGGTDFSNKVRQLLVEKQADDIDAMTEVLLVNAARRQHLQKKITPALQKKQWVICDRFIDSTLVYQGIVQGVPMELLDHLHANTCFNIYPHLTLLLDIPVDVGLGRTQVRQEAKHEQRFESKGIQFHEAVRKGFLEVAERYQNRVHVLDATQSVESVAEEAQQFVKGFFF